MSNEPTPRAALWRDLQEKAGEMLARLPRVDHNGYYHPEPEPDPEPPSAAQRLAQLAADAGDTKFAAQIGTEFGVDVELPPTPGPVDFGARAGGTQVPTIDEAIRAALERGDHATVRRLDAQRIADQFAERYG
jgi:hypothetical protein